MQDVLLRVENLCVEYPGRPPKKAVDDASFTVARGACVGIVGGSGCGKTTIARTIIGLERPSAGRIVFEGEPIASASRSADLRRRRDIQLVFQDSLGALNPRMRIGATLAEVLRHHRRDDVPTAAALDARLRELVGQVELAPDVLAKYPHEISGGQRQRIGVARALAVRPKLLIADEPVSALDVAVQAQMLKMLRRLLDATGLTMLFIAHDLAVVRCLCDAAVVMHAGRVVEQGDPREVFSRPRSEAARALVQAVPDVVRAMAERFAGPQAARLDARV
ncbi:MAG: ABC transporter ATP-binding protein [Lentisphaerae bacterium]|nr:ABC transporter ATP-binding protein [Lentisphaerota bacterium]